MRILIAGAGVGGLALARGLVGKGHEVSVLEWSTGLREGGAAVSIFSNGAAVMAALGAPLEGIGGTVEELRFCTDKGQSMAAIDLRPMARKTGFGVTTVSRRQLVGLLADGVPEVRFGCGVEDIRHHADSVEVVDSQGGVHEAELLVGADGVASRVRRLIDPTPAAYAGWATWQGLEPLPIEVADGTYGLCMVGEAGFCGLMPAGDGMVQWWFDTPWTPEDSPEAPAEWLRDRFQHYADPVPKVLAAITDAGLYPHVIHEVPDVWGLARTTLVGDAAHAFPPTLAQGANQTLEDAWMLTRTLTEPSGDLTTALRNYEQRRTRKVRRVSRLARTELTNKPPHPLVRRLAPMIPRSLISRAYLTQLKGWSDVL